MNQPYPTGTEADICNDIARRQQVGLIKYGTSIRDNPLELKQWLQHAYEEVLDQAVYLKRAMEEIDNEKNVHLDGSEILLTFGGESGDEFGGDEYGIDFEKCVIQGLTPSQMNSLARCMINHLSVNGHEFEFKSGDQDRPRMLVSS